MIQTKKLTEHVWLMDDQGSSGYVVLGEKKALVVDTMNGSENVKEIVRTITDLPVMVINTHVHPDHIGGNHFFDEVYMSPYDMPYVEMFTAPENLDKRPVVHPVREGNVIDLGGLHVEVYELPGHTPGELCLLLVEEQILFPGDGINHHLWMQLEGCSSLEEYAKSLERLDFLKKKAKYILHGHTRELENIILFDMVEHGIGELLNQTDQEVTKCDDAYHWFGGIAKIHVYAPDGSAICYQENHIS